MTTPKLSILICTIGQRNERFKKLVSKLLKQGEGLPIEVVAYWNNGERPLSDIRQYLVEQARGEYVCFVDDDDDVPDYYCQAIVARLDGVDYIGWQMQLYHNGEPSKPTYHSLRYSHWYEDADGYYRNISHLNPMKRSLVLQQKFASEPGVAEDASWAERIAPFVVTEHYINKIMYIYNHRTDDSVWRGNVTPGEYNRPTIRHKQFRWVRHGNT